MWSTNGSKTSIANLKPYLEILIEGDRSLTSKEAELAFGEILSGAEEVQVGSLLMLLRARGETPEEIAGMVRALMSVCNRVPLDDLGLSQRWWLDIVGTGGDGADTINISTAAAVLAAACGCIVAKAGNRAASSKCGSADVLEALGVRVDLNPNQVRECVAQVGVAFLMAPVFHPAVRIVAPVRQKLGIRTCFNLLGPLTNAAGSQRAVIGVAKPHLLPLMAGALKNLGHIDHAVIVHGCGLDEISPLGPSRIVEIRNVASEGEPRVYVEKEYDFDPLEIGIPRCQLSDLRGGGPQENAEQFRQVLLPGTPTDAKRDAIVLNAGFGCYVYGLTESIDEGCRLARTTLESGKAELVLQEWIRVSQNIANGSAKEAVQVK